ncbi:protein-export chaperone SecB [Permianibacter sp. IMCC34836]|uniref:protein-export chaperone SecB n=1 Tax=Permianibacter fluminis TaxID=2738515 RepID=UPI001555B151|nr:protein-export chaperone SecB [Permianibacter fluminis]NQD36192.1 protein-export chaperone SecB [Permianibacter fluminis]
MAEEIQGATNAQQPSLNLGRVYLKDLSFEAPNTPELFQTAFEPNYAVQLNSKARKLDDNNYEVILVINVECKSGDKVAFVCEVQQAGVFTISGVEGMQLRHALTAYTPSLLFPYARQVIAAAIGQGGFPALHLAPVNFDQIFAMQLQREAEQAQAGNSAEASTVQ